MPGGALVGLHSSQCLPQIVTLDNRFHGRPNRRPAFDIGPRRAGFGLFGRRRFGLHPLRRCPSSARPVFSAAWPVRDRRSTCLFHRSGLRRVAPATMPSADFCAAVRIALRRTSVPLPGQRRRPPEVRSIAFAARPPDLPPRPLMAVDFAVVSLLVRPGRPRYPVLVHRAAALLHASFRPHLAVGSARAEHALAFR